MNIVLSSAMLAIALLMIAHSISELKPKQKKAVKAVKKVTSREHYKHFDLEATRLEKGGKRK